MADQEHRSSSPESAEYRESEERVLAEDDDELIWEAGRGLTGFIDEGLDDEDEDEDTDYRDEPLEDEEDIDDDDDEFHGKFILCASRLLKSIIC
jgi:hypothetical protein